MYQYFIKSIFGFVKNDMPAGFFEFVIWIVIIGFTYKGKIETNSIMIPTYIEIHDPVFRVNWFFIFWALILPIGDPMINLVPGGLDRSSSEL